MLAAIPPQRLNQKVDDAHLGEIARKLINWKSMCTNLAINEAEEKAIEEENKEVDVRRYLHRAFVLLLRSVVHMCASAFKALNYAGRHNRTETTLRCSTLLGNTCLYYLVSLCQP